MSVTVGPYTVTRGELIPHSREYESYQTVNVAENGFPWIAEKRYDVRYLNVRLVDDLATIREVVDFIRNGMRYSAVAFNYVDGFGTTWRVRYWGKGKITEKYLGSDRVEVVLLFRVEV